MKSTGVVRPVDQLGRVVIPMELRRTMDIKQDDPMEIFTEGDTIMLRKYTPGCIFCGRTDIKVIINGKMVCEKCLQSIAARERSGT